MYVHRSTFLAVCAQASGPIAATRALLAMQITPDSNDTFVGVNVVLVRESPLVTPRQMTGQRLRMVAPAPMRRR